MAGNLVISQINGGPIGVINAIINGNFQVNQRGVSGTVTLAAGAYGHDRWKAGASGCTYTFATSNNVTTLTISSGSLIQVIEGINLYSGTYTLSWSGTAQGKIGAGSYAGSGVTGSVTGGTNLNIEFGTGTLSLVQFEPGVEASPFERRDYGRELMMCQRYFESSFADGVAPGTLSTAVVNTGAFGLNGSYSGSFAFPFKIRKRAAPTVTVYAPLDGTSSGRVRRGDTGAINTVSSPLISQEYANLNIDSGVSGALYQFGFAASAEL
jgi:hypothetical protein